MGNLLDLAPRRRIVGLNRFISDLAKTECFGGGNLVLQAARSGLCLLYTSDAADE